MTHVLIVSARFYPDIAAALEKSAQGALKQAGATCDIIEVPGAFEIPAAIGFALLPLPSREGRGEGIAAGSALSMPHLPHPSAYGSHLLPKGEGKTRYDGFIALGCVIRGETSHYDYVCQESARGLMGLSLQHGAAIGYGILTVDNEEQARARLDKGADAAKACLRMVDIKRRFQA